jgi:hypothetical protein
MKTTLNSLMIMQVNMNGANHDDIIPKPKESVPSGKSLSTRTRDILSNITNHNNTKVSKKRSSTVIENEASTNNHQKTTKLKNIKNSKRKTDPMEILQDIEEEEEKTTTTTKEASLVVSLPVELLYDDIDKNDSLDAQSVTEYVNDIYQYLMEKEKDAVDPHYLNKLLDINSNMRAVLIDWLVEVHRMFKLISETLFMAVSLIDRYLSISSTVSRDNLQLLGTTALFIASKYEEIYAPECMDFVYVCDGGCTKQQILKMEQTVLNTLHFNLTHPTPLHFLRRYSKASDSDYLLHTLCKYLIELSLLDINLLKYAPSLISAASVYLGRAMVGKVPSWTPTLEYYTTYKESKVRECACALNGFLKKTQKSTSLKAIKKKYSTEKFGKVSEISLVEIMDIS